MEITFLGAGAPLNVSRATTGMVLTVDGCAPLLCSGFELARVLDASGLPLAMIRNVIVTHRHFGMMALFMANMPLDLHALDDTYAGFLK